MGVISYHVNRCFILTVALLVSGSLFVVSCQKSPAAASFTQADLDKLRWIEGKWKGTGSDPAKPFFESYKFTSDGKLENTSYGSDATFTTIENSGSVFVENGEILHKGGDWVWAASKVTDSMIEFVPRKKATNAFVWKKESTDLWMAILANKNSAGKIVETVYRMERVK